MIRNGSAPYWVSVAFSARVTPYMVSVGLASQRHLFRLKMGTAENTAVKMFPTESVLLWIYLTCFISPRSSRLDKKLPTPKLNSILLMKTKMKMTTSTGYPSSSIPP